MNAASRARIHGWLIVAALAAVAVAHGATEKLDETPVVGADSAATEPQRSVATE
jgi:hypothetical protein